MVSRRVDLSFQRLALLAGTFGLAVLPALAQQNDIGPIAQQQIAGIAAVKRNFTPAQKKLDSGLAFAAMAVTNRLAGASFLNAVSRAGATSASSNVMVDIRGSVSPQLLAAITAANGTVRYQSARWGVVRASLPIGAMETVAANINVRSISKAAAMRTNGFRLPRRLQAPRRATTIDQVFGRGLDFFIGSLTTQGYVSHGANTVVGSGINGSGVTVGVLSDSATAARVAALIATGDLPAGAHSLPGLDGDATDEGAAMMEIVHDIAPGANIIFATADNGEASFADNIIALQQAGCQVIVDDVTYLDEGVFQDGLIAQAVNTVTAAGVTYFSAAANSGNLTFNTSGTWEGDFLDGGLATGVLNGAGTVHNFRTVANPQTYTALTAPSDFGVFTLKWSDPLGASSNDYDLYVLDSTGANVKAFSAGAQTGTQDPIEGIEVNGTACGGTDPTGYCQAANDRFVVVLFLGDPRALHLDTNRGRISIRTAGSTYGHNAGANTVSLAATYWNSAKTGTRPFTGATNPIEVFSSDGPRKIFYNPDGSPITQGNFLFGSNGGTTLQKPDITAADGVSARTPGFNPFYGTSAAAPHAAGIAALVLQARPAYTPAQVKAALIAGSLDNMAAGADRDSGYGVVMATLAVAYALSH